MLASICDLHTNNRIAKWIKQFSHWWDEVSWQVFDLSTCETQGTGWWELGKMRAEAISAAIHPPRPQLSSISPEAPTIMTGEMAVTGWIFCLLGTRDPWESKWQLQWWRSTFWNPTIMPAPLDSWTIGLPQGQLVIVQLPCPGHWEW